MYRSIDVMAIRKRFGEVLAKVHAGDIVTIERYGKSIAVLLSIETAEKKGILEESFDPHQDPVYQMEGYDFEAPDDFGTNPDKYLYE